jgi:hypothetical protein
MTFYCNQQWEDGEKEEWSGKISRIIPYGSHYEIFIQSRSSILVVVALNNTVDGITVACALQSLSDELLFN